MKKGVIGVFVLMVLFLLLLLLTVGCTTTRYVPVPEVHTEYVSSTDTFISVEKEYVHDSVLVQQRGDTVFVDRWHTKYMDNDKLKVRIDTIEKRDSVPVPYPVEVVKEPSLGDRLWQYGISFVIAILVLVIIRLLVRKVH